MTFKLRTTMPRFCPWFVATLPQAVQVGEHEMQVFELDGDQAEKLSYLPWFRPCLIAIRSQARKCNRAIGAHAH
jgi:hypothetical protein